MAIAYMSSIASARPVNLEIHVQSFSIPHFPSLMIAMAKPAYVAIKDYSSTKPVIIFTPSRRQCRLTANDILSHCIADDNQDQFLNYELEKLQPHLDHISDQDLVETLKHGIGFYHEALDKQDKKIVERLFEAGAIQVLIASRVSILSHVSNSCRSDELLRKPHGVCPSMHIWSSSWGFSSLKDASIATRIIPWLTCFR